MVGVQQQYLKQETEVKKRGQIHSPAAQHDYWYFIICCFNIISSYFSIIKYIISCVISPSIPVASLWLDPSVPCSPLFLLQPLWLAEWFCWRTAVRCRHSGVRSFLPRQYSTQPSGGISSLDLLTCFKAFDFASNYVHKICGQLIHHSFVHVINLRACTHIYTLKSRAEWVFFYFLPMNLCVIHNKEQGRTSENKDPWGIPLTGRVKPGEIFWTGLRNAHQ